jgi:hypothetical protein
VKTSKLGRTVRRLGWGIATTTVLAFSGCGGSQQQYVHIGSPPPSPPVLSGKATFERLLPTADLDPDRRERVQAALDFANPIQRPVRYARTELLDDADQVLDQGSTDGQGQFAFMVPPGEGPVRVRVYTETVPVEGVTGALQVQDNTQGGAVYAVETDPLERTSLEIDLEVPTGYDSQGNQPGPTRPSAPFACLDGVMTGYSYLLEGAMDPSGLPLCKVNWSQLNRPEPGDVTQGQVATSHYNPTSNEVFILGFREADTDEFDWHVMVHEFGHWIQANRFSYDSPGGEHQGAERKDPRLAFGEAFGDAFGALALGDPVYKDTLSPFGAARSLECNAVFPGWYSELSVSAMLLDLFDPVRQEGGDSDFDDQLELPRSLLVEALSYQTSSPAPPTIFSFLHGLVRAGLTPQQSEALAALMRKETADARDGINSLDEFAQGETHDGGVYPLPLFADLTPMLSQGSPLTLTLTVDGQESSTARNWLSGVRFYRFVGDGSELNITARNSTSAQGGLTLDLLEDGEGVASYWNLEAPFEDATIEGTVEEGAVYVLVVTNPNTESSTTELTFTRL